MNKQELVSVASELRKIGNEAQKILGCGFNEVIFQNALAIEFRKRKIEYLKEVNIEIFYKGESVGVDVARSGVGVPAGRGLPAA